MRKLAPARVSYRDDFWFRVAFIWWLGHSLSRYLKVNFMLIKHVWFKIANITHALLVPVYRQTDFLPEQVDVLRLLWYRCEISYQSEILAPVRQPGWTQTRGDSCRHDILWWYHVNKCKAIRGNWSELAPARKSPRCHVNTPLTCIRIIKKFIFI